MTFVDVHYIFTTLCPVITKAAHSGVFMKKFTNLLVLLLLSVPAFLVSGCGGGSGSSSTVVDTTSVRQGAVVQGPVTGATVFADNVSGGIRFLRDVGEITVQTNSKGEYFLPSFPSYNFILVSTGGTDTVSGQKALLLLAPAGSKNITPLTTLVTLDTTNALKAKLQSLMGGASFDSNVATSSTQAALMLVKSVENAVQRMRDVVLLSVPAGVTLDEVQVNYIQAQIWQQIAAGLADPTVTVQDMATPSRVTAILKAALATAAANIKTQNANIPGTFNATSVDSIAAGAVDLALIAIGAGVDSTSVNPLGVTSILSELSLVASISAAYASFSSGTGTIQALSSVIVTGTTPNPFGPTPIPVVTIDNATIIRILTGATGGQPITGITF